MAVATRVVEEMLEDSDPEERIIDQFLSWTRRRDLTVGFRGHRHDEWDRHPDPRPATEVITEELAMDQQPVVETEFVFVAEEGELIILLEGDAFSTELIESQDWETDFWADYRAGAEIAHLCRTNGIPMPIRLVA